MIVFSATGTCPTSQLCQDNSPSHHKREATTIESSYHYIHIVLDAGKRAGFFCYHVKYHSLKMLGTSSALSLHKLLIAYGTASHKLLPIRYGTESHKLLPIRYGTASHKLLLIKYDTASHKLLPIRYETASHQLL